MLGAIMRYLRLIIAATLAVLALAACSGGDDASGPPSGRIAFVSKRDGNQEIYIMNADGSGQVNLSQTPADEDDPWWSPDGTLIGFSSGRGHQSDLWTMDATGGSVKQLTNDGAVDGQPRWSPDGKRIAFYSFRNPARGYLWVANADGSGATAVLGKLFPAVADQECAGGFPGGWYPDGQHILYRGSWGAGSALQICSVKADGQDLSSLYKENSVMATFPALSPDASKIAFVTNTDGNDEIYVMDANGSNPLRVTNDDGKDEWPVWSPDGKWIAFSSDRDGDFEIYIVRLDGSGLKKLTDNTVADTAPAWSP